MGPTRALLVMIAATTALLGGLAAAHAGGSGTTKVYHRWSFDHWGGASATNPGWGGSSWTTTDTSIVYSEPYGKGGTPAPTRSLYRCKGERPYGIVDYFVKNGKTCPNGKSGVLLGYVLREPRKGHIPLYRCISTNKDRQVANGSCGEMTKDRLLGYARKESYENKHRLAKNTGNRDCRGKCGYGCTWMPWTSYTSACRAHDDCVYQKRSHLACIPQLFPAAVSYVIDGARQLIKSVVDAVRSIFDWF